MIKHFGVFDQRTVPVLDAEILKCFCVWQWHIQGVLLPLLWKVFWRGREAALRCMEFLRETSTYQNSLSSEFLVCSSQSFNSPWNVASGKIWLYVFLLVWQILNTVGRLSLPAPGSQLDTQCWHERRDSKKRTTIADWSIGKRKIQNQL